MPNPIFEVPRKTLVTAVQCNIQYPKLTYKRLKIIGFPSAPIIPPLCANFQILRLPILLLTVSWGLCAQISVVPRSPKSFTTEGSSQFCTGGNLPAQILRPAHYTPGGTPGSGGLSGSRLGTCK